MPEAPIQILEIRAGEGELPPAITATVGASANQAILVALSEQLDRRRQEPLVSVDDVRELRQDAGLVERFGSLAAAGAHAVVSFSATDLQACLLSLSRYVDRVDGDHFQPADLRARLQVIAEVVPVLWDANATAAQIADIPLARAGR